MKTKHRLISFPIREVTIISRFFILVNTLFICLCSTVYAKDVLTVGAFGMDNNHRYSFDWLAREFQRKYPDVSLNIISRNDKNYKTSINQWLNEGKGPDVVLWQGGERLFHFAKNNKLQPVTTLWQTQKLDDIFDHKLNKNLTMNGERYGIPVSYYNWGFYYRKSLFRSA